MKLIKVVFAVLIAFQLSLITGCAKSPIEDQRGTLSYATRAVRRAEGATYRTSSQALSNLIVDAQIAINDVVKTSANQHELMRLQSNMN